ncbi:hypothetical protein D9613_000035 [Agrocybe pediades]|uniref:F-box domain-containing protein n=1 Tax=Agrocybe pediades TaxID=84607 RepID=A0A8H4R2T2_9AGAR|nr:hypothetical protein D9613_000035 [Agrocybe pediades]
MSLSVSRASAVERDVDVLTILTLPLEMLTEILKELNLLDILQIRQTCKILHHATTAKPIWVDLFWECERLSPGILTLEKPLDMYSSEELERVVLTWGSMQVGWHTSDGTPSRQRTITSEYYSNVYLVPGGRWLLVFQNEGGISYYDLESPTYDKQKMLVPDYIRQAASNLVFYTVDSPCRLPLRNFKVAQYVREDPDAVEGNAYRAIKIWNIYFTAEGQVTTGLHATCLKTILVDPRGLDCQLSLSLKDQHLAFALSPDFLGQQALMRRYICVVEWPLVEEDSLEYHRKLIYVDMEAVRSFLCMPVDPRLTCRQHEIHLLPNHRVLAFAPPNLSVYVYSSLDYTDRMPVLSPGELPELTPPANCSLRPCASQTRLSVPFTVEDGVYFLCFDNDTARSVYISNDFGAAGSFPRELHVKTLIRLPAHRYAKRSWTARYSFGRCHCVLSRVNNETKSIELLLFKYDLEQDFAPDYVPVIKANVLLLLCGIPSVRASMFFLTRGQVVWWYPIGVSTYWTSLLYINARRVALLGNQWARYSFGQRHGILFRINRQTDLTEFLLLEYDLGQEFAPDYVPVTKVIPCKKANLLGDESDHAGKDCPLPLWGYQVPYRNVLLDEGSGRVVVPYQQRFEILDFALIYRS